jgi:hypothetical protein
LKYLQSSTFRCLTRYGRAPPWPVVNGGTRAVGI